MKYNETTCTCQRPIEMSLPILEDVIKKLEDMPPTLTEIRCSKDAYNYIRAVTYCDSKGISLLPQGLKVIKADYIKTGEIENVFSDGSIKTVKFF